MSRKIKFRGKRLDNGEWVYGFYITYGWTGKQSHYIAPDYASALYAIEIDQTTVGQFTGLHDKNGKEIYEGDIINGFDNKPNPYAIKYGSDAMFYGESDPYNEIAGAGTQTVGLNNAPDWVNVIGNIHDNPELLKEDK